MSPLPSSQAPNLRGARRPVVHRNDRRKEWRRSRATNTLPTAKPGTALLSLFFFSFLFIPPWPRVSPADLDPHPRRADARRTPLMPSWHFSSRRAQTDRMEVPIEKKKMQCPCVHPPVHILDKKRRPLATTDIKNSYLRRFINGIILGRRSGAIWRDRVEHCSFRSVVIRSRASKTLRTRLRTPPGQNANGINRKKTDRHVALELLWIMILIRICGRGDENVHLRRADVKRQSTRPDSFVYPVQSSAGPSILNKSISSVAGVTCPTTFA